MTGAKFLNTSSVSLIRRFLETLLMKENNRDTFLKLKLTMLLQLQKKLKMELAKIIIWYISILRTISTIEIYLLTLEVSFWHDILGKHQDDTSFEINIRPASTQKNMQAKGEDSQRFNFYKTSKFDGPSHPIITTNLHPMCKTFDSEERIITRDVRNYTVHNLTRKDLQKIKDKRNISLTSNSSRNKLGIKFGCCLQNRRCLSIDNSPQKTRGNVEKFRLKKQTQCIRSIF